MTSNNDRNFWDLAVGDRVEADFCGTQGLDVRTATVIEKAGNLPSMDGQLSVTLWVDAIDEERPQQVAVVYTNRHWWAIGAIGGGVHLLRRLESADSADGTPPVLPRADEIADPGLDPGDEISELVRGQYVYIQRADEETARSAQVLHNRPGDGSRPRTVTFRELADQFDREEDIDAHPVHGRWCAGPLDATLILRCAFPLRPGVVLLDEQ